jgi:hypothetical protein
MVLLNIVSNLCTLSFPQHNFLWDILGDLWHNKCSHCSLAFLWCILISPYWNLILFSEIGGQLIIFTVPVVIILNYCSCCYYIILIPDTIYNQYILQYILMIKRISHLMLILLKVFFPLQNAWSGTDCFHEANNVP